MQRVNDLYSIDFTRSLPPALNPPFYLYRVRIVVPIDVEIIGQNIKGLFVQFVNAGIDYVLLDLPCRGL